MRLTDTAPVLCHQDSEITFVVDEVTAPADRLPTVPIHVRWKEQIEQDLWTSSHDGDFRVLAECPYHPLVSAVHLAFSRHYPLALTPDIVWMTIAQGFAQHVNNHAEALRFRLVRHEGKLRLEAKTMALEQPADWADVIEQWSQGIGAHVGVELRDLLLCNFSTSTPVIRTASQVVMMDAFRQYFDYHILCICGIPQITLHGTVEDWRTIQNRVRRLAEYDLSWWTDRLLPLCDAFVQTAEGAPSRSFWQRIYMPGETYGGGRVNGWLGDLFPYVRDHITKAPVVRNPLLDRSRTEWTVEDGPFPDAFPDGLSQAPATLEIVASGERRDLSFIGGFLGATQDIQSGCIGVEIGWAVHERDDFAGALSTIVRDHAMGPPLPRPVFGRQQEHDGIPGELFQMLDRFDGGTLFEGTPHPWHLRRLEDYTTLLLKSNGSRDETVTCFLDLEDGRAVGYTFVLREDSGGGNRWAHEWWIVAGRPGKGLTLEFDVEYYNNLGAERASRRGLRALWGRIYEDRKREPPRYVEREVDVLHPDETLVVAKGFGLFFQRVLEADGAYFFDEIGAGCPSWREASSSE